MGFLKLHSVAKNEKKWRPFGALKNFRMNKIEKFELSHSVKEFERGLFGVFLTSILLQIIRKFKGTLRRHRNIFEKSLIVSKKVENRDPFAFEWFFVSC